MTSYPRAAPSPFNSAHAALSKAEIARAVPTAEGDAAFRYLTGQRGIPPGVLLGCADVRTLPAPILGRDRVDFACVSLLRPAPGADPTGAELAFIDVLGRPSATEPRRVQWRFTEHGCRDSWFFAGGSGNVAVVSEGFCAKPLATLACGVPGLHLGWGARSWLQFKAPLPASIKKITIVQDRRPSP